MRRIGFRRLAVGMVLVSVAAVVASSAAVSPQLLGRYFTIFEDVRDGVLVYKVEARVIGIIPVTTKVADLEVQVRITNHHSVDVHLVSAHFTVVDLHLGRTTLVFDLEDETIPSGSVVVIDTLARVTKILGVGNRYLVTGTVIWEELSGGTVVGGPFVRAFEEAHSLTEFVR